MPNRTIRTAAAGLAVVALAGCGTTTPWEGTALDETGWWACDDFGAAMRDAGGAEVSYALPRTERAPFAAAVAEYGGQSGAGQIADNAVTLTEAVEGPQRTWQYGMDLFASECQDLGWDPN